MTKKSRLRISSESDVSRALIAASQSARSLGYNKLDTQAIATAVSELARNILKYAGTGEIQIDELSSERQIGVQITARDKGPGISDLKAAMRDHFSSGGTLGLGLPGVKRIMDDFEVTCPPEGGTYVVVRKWLRRRQSSKKPSAVAGIVSRKLQERRFGEGHTGRLDDPNEEPTDHLDCAYFVRPCIGERVSGDAAVVERRDDRIFLGIVDGLGHGPEAYAVAKEAVTFLRRSWQSNVVSTLSELHEALKGTPGAAAGLSVVDTKTRSMSYAGVGNTVVRSFGHREMRFHSSGGTLGHQMRTPKERTFKLQDRDVLILYTDGVKERFELTDYPQLLYQSARTIARTIVDRFGKAYDDATCIALRCGE
jgi:anti-sigma regulatory factor (Ser/Thr protein kinase)/serine/threonine protein phosphatase PrpC